MHVGDGNKLNRTVVHGLCVRARMLLLRFLLASWREVLYAAVSRRREGVSFAGYFLFSMVYDGGGRANRASAGEEEATRCALIVRTSSWQCALGVHCAAPRGWQPGAECVTHPTGLSLSLCLSLYPARSSAPFPLPRWLSLRCERAARSAAPNGLNIDSSVALLSPRYTVRPCSALSRASTDFHESVDK